MKKEDIITLPNQNLRKKCERVHVITDEVRQIVQDMIDASLDWENAHPHEISAAIAAPQINKLYKIIIVRSDLDDKNNKEFTALINPEITKFEGKTDVDFEGCLSIKEFTVKFLAHQKFALKRLIFTVMKFELKPKISLRVYFNMKLTTQTAFFSLIISAIKKTLSTDLTKMANYNH